MRTEVTLGTQLQLGPHFSFLGLGSCFVNNLAPYLAPYASRSVTNPLGTTFNPISIADQLQWLYQPAFQFPQAVQYGSEYHALDAAYVFRNENETVLKNNIEQKRTEGLDICRGRNPVVLITFGTAHAWRYEGRVVNNCHKLPQQWFERKMLSVEEIVQRWKELIPFIPRETLFIFTLSPVRYTRVGLVENSKSKAVLRLAIDRLLQLIPNSHYFPSFEIITDELRDYRYFNEHGTHPNNEAIEEVWARLAQFLGLSQSEGRR